MTISSAAEAVEARDKAQHLFHQIEGKQATLKALLIDLDAWVVAQLTPHDTTGTVHPMEGGGNKPGG